MNYKYLFRNFVSIVLSRPRELNNLENSGAPLTYPFVCQEGFGFIVLGHIRFNLVVTILNFRLLSVNFLDEIKLASRVAGDAG